MDEILKYHQETLKLVVNETNKKYREYVDKREREEEKRRLLEDEHRQEVNRIASQLDFDED